MAWIPSSFWVVSSNTSCSLHQRCSLCHLPPLYAVRGMTWNATSTGRSKLVTSHPEAALEALADHVEGDWVDAGVDGGHVDANVVQHQEEAKRMTLLSTVLRHCETFTSQSSRTWAAHSDLDPSRRKWWASGCGWGGEAASTKRRPGPGRTLSWQPPFAGFANQSTRAVDHSAQWIVRSKVLLWKWEAEMPSDLLQVIAEGDLDAVLLPQHLTGHQGVENSSAG